MRIVLSICLLAKAYESSYTYIAVNQLKTWPDAEAYCQSQHGTHLATIFNDESANALVAVRNANLNGQYVWIGLNDRATEGEFVWADGTRCPSQYGGTCRDNYGYPYWNPGWFEDARYPDLQCVMMLYQTSDINFILGEADCAGPGQPFICNAPAYIAVNQLKTWSAADAYCQSQYGTHLATLFDDDSARELVFVRNANLNGQYVWIGLNDRANEGEFVWADGTLCPYQYGGTCRDDKGYPYWNPGWFEDARYPDLQCVMMLYQTNDITMLLGEADCDEGGRPFICNVTPTTPSPSQAPTNDPTQNPSTSPSKYPTVHTTEPTKTPTNNPTQNPSKSPSKYPTMYTNEPSETPTNNPTHDPTHPSAQPTADPTIEPTVEPTTEPTVEPTRDPTVDPTKDPTGDPTKDPTHVPTRDPTMDPTIDPTIDPTVDPTTDPTQDPTRDPTEYPTTDPTGNPTIDPTADPTVDPTIDPTDDPTVDPTADPTNDPTVNPSIDPTTAPTVSPSTAPHSLKMEIELSLESDDSNMNEVYIYCILFGMPALIIIFVFIMKSTLLKDKLLSIDRVQYVSVALYFLQVFDLYSDAMFTLQLYSYYAWAKHTDYEITSSEINEFYFLFLFSLGFTILPYCANFVSSGRIVAMITADPIISIYSKEWFKYNSGNYSIGVLLSGGSYFTLKVINSNFLGLPQLSAGLSAKQIERFAAHKVLYNTLMENFPQMILQFYFLWGLGLVTSIVVISLILSLFNILLSVLSTWMRRSSFAFQKEFPFTINVSIVENADGDGNGNPYRNAGRIERLSEVLKSLARENRHHFSFEIMTFSRIEKSLYGVVIYKDANVEDIKTFLDNNIEKAVLTAFECDEYAFSVMCMYPMDSYNVSGDATADTNTKKVDYKADNASHAIVVEMNKVQSDEDDEGEGAEGNEALPQHMGGTDFNVTKREAIKAKSGSESEDEIALPEPKQTTAGADEDTEFEALSVEQILLQSWNLGQYWSKIKQLGYDDHKYWKTLINNADVLSEIFGATKGHQERFVDYVQQMK